MLLTHAGPVRPFPGIGNREARLAELMRETCDKCGWRCGSGVEGGRARSAKYGRVVARDERRKRWDIEVLAWSCPRCSAPIFLLTQDAPFDVRVAVAGDESLDAEMHEHVQLTRRRGRAARARKAKPKRRSRR